MKKLLATIILICLLGTGGFGRTAQAAATELYSTSLYSDSGLIRYYRLEDLTDTKNGFTLTNNNSVATSTGKFGNAYTSGTSNSNLFLNNTTDLGLAGGTSSISAWVKLNGNHTDSDHPQGLSQNSQAAKVMFSINFSQTNTSVSFSRLREGTAWDDATYTVSPGTTNWHCYVLTYSGASGLLSGYYDGNLVATTTSTGGGAAVNSRLNGPSFFASQATSLGNRGNDQVDDAAFWNRVLTATEASNICNGFPVTNVSFPNIIMFE